MSDDTGPSLVDLLRARYEQIHARPEPTFHLPVTFGVSDGATKQGGVGMLVEYRQPKWDRTLEIRKKYATDKNPRAVLYAACEQLASACVDIWARDDEHGQEIEGYKGRWQPGLGEGAGPVNFSKAAQLLGLPANDGIQAVTAVLVEDWQIEAHDEQVGLWEPPPPSEVGDFAGESRAAS